MAERGVAVVTTVNPPTPAVESLAADGRWDVVVVGDEGTPPEWHVADALFLSAEDQRSMRHRIASLLPWRHYSRKAIGYLVAIERGVDRILDTDDDNVRTEEETGGDTPGTFDVTPEGLGFVNVYRLFTDDLAWPRGFPLSRILDPDARIDESRLTRRSVAVAVWQGLVTGDPDVDAVYRLTRDEPIRFREREPVVLARGSVSPFNSQNTVFSRQAFPLLYLPATVSFRFCDILRSIVAQPILWAAELHVGFTRASAHQVRNEHDLLSDFRDELSMYLDVERAFDTVSGVVEDGRSMEANLRASYAALARHGIVRPAELTILDAWLADVSDATDGSARPSAAGTDDVLTTS